MISVKGALIDLRMHTYPCNIPCDYPGNGYVGFGPLSEGTFHVVVAMGTILSVKYFAP